MENDQHPITNDQSSSGLVAFLSGLRFQVSGLCVLLLLAGVPASADDAALRSQINDLFRKRQFIEATATLEKITAAEPTNAEAWHFLDQAYLARNDYEKAIAAGEKAVELDPTKSEYQFHLGNAYGYAAQKVGMFSKIGMAKKCKAAYDRAVELDPKNLGARWGVLEFCRQAPSIMGGGMDGAYAQAGEIKKLDPVQGRRAFATLYASDKKYADAFALYEENLKEKPGDADTLNALGRLAISTGEQLDRGLAALRELQTQPGRDRDARLHWRIGTLLEKKGDKPAAKSAYETALALDPNLTQAAEALKKL